MGERQQVILRVPPLPGFLADRLPGLVRCALDLLTDAATAHWRRRWTAHPDLVGADVARLGAELSAAWGHGWDLPAEWYAPPGRGRARNQAVDSAREDLSLSRVQWLAGLLEAAAAAALASPMNVGRRPLTPAQAERGSSAYAWQ